MKFVKKLTALFLAIVMTMAMGITAFAGENDNYTITVNGRCGHTYEAYQIFKGDLDSTEKTLTEVDWGTGVNGTALLAELKTENGKFYNTFKDCTTAADVADAIADNFTSDSDDLIELSKIIGKHLTTTKVTSTVKSQDTAKNTAVYELAVKGSGYYFVKDQDDSQKDKDAYTRFILKVVKDETVTAKDSVPEIDKKIIEGDKKVDANTAYVGEEVKYEITSTVPNMKGYTKYFFVVNDTLSKGLTYDGDSSMEVYIGSTKLTQTTKDSEVKTNAYYVTSVVNADGTTSLTIVFKDFLQYKDLNGSAIKINYSATLNQDAVLTDEGNPNTVELTYSNNPNVTTDNDTDEPDDDDVTGKTPEKKVVTYTTGIKLTKVDAADHTKTLTGAKFSISGESQKVVIVNNEIYQAATDGEYWRLTDGTYTNEDPATKTEETQKKYEANADGSYTKYKKVTVVNKESRSQTFVTEGYVGSDGVITFRDLGEGTYTIKELVAPDGYNLLKEPITVVISANANDKGANWTVKVDGKEISSVTYKDLPLYAFEVENNSGSVLPSTGGMGTTMIYFAGIAMIVAAGVVVIARKRFA